MSTTQLATPKSSTATTTVGGKYLTFVLGDEEYGLEILKVREIIGCMEITSIPRMPSYIKGVINLRGQVISVMDLRARFGMTAKEKTEHTCIIVVEIKRDGRQIRCGLIVDRVSDVLTITDGQLEPPPDFGTGSHVEFILGIGKIGSSVKLLVDIDNVVGTNEVASATLVNGGHP